MKKIHEDNNQKKGKRPYMNRKMRFKIALDIAMTFGLLFLMGYQLWGEAAHEWVGAGLFILFILHNILNRNWYKNLFRGRYTALRVMQAAVNMLLLISMMCMMYSGIVLSRYAFAFLSIRGGMSLARILHMAGAYWGFVLMAVHLGLHWKMFLGMASRGFNSKTFPWSLCILLPLAGTAIAVYGLSGFIRRVLLTYMLVRTEFVFLDYNEPPLMFYLDYMAMMGLFIYLAHYGAKLPALLGKKKMGTEINKEQEQHTEP